jgi:hypothetical protein
VVYRKSWQERVDCDDALAECMPDAVILLPGAQIGSGNEADPACLYTPLGATSWAWRAHFFAWHVKQTDEPFDIRGF